MRASSLSKANPTSPGPQVATCWTDELLDDYNEDSDSSDHDLLADVDDEDAEFAEEDNESIDDILDAVEPTVDVTDIITPVYNFKASKAEFDEETADGED